MKHEQLKIKDGGAGSFIKYLSKLGKARRSRYAEIGLLWCLMLGERRSFYQQESEQAESSERKREGMECCGDYRTFYIRRLMDLKTKTLFKF